jgi:hypothetical protein
MSNIQDKRKTAADKKNYSSPAKSVMTNLKPILSKSSELQERWVWELLQNASDLGTSINVKFEITNEKLIFKHNGKNFNWDEVDNLIKPDSNKDDEDHYKKSIIGQFGTGFISTHILSKIIHVNGIIEDDEGHYRFNFPLDRSERTDKEFLIRSIQTSDKKYGESLEEINLLPDDEFNTSFTYFTNNTYDLLDAEDTINNGIESFKKLIPFVLSFRYQLGEILIVDSRDEETSWLYKREKVQTEIKNLTIIKVICFKDGVHYQDQLVGNISENNTIIGFSIEHLVDEKYKLLPFPPKCPKLFSAFPMIGTSEFNFPVIIHSEEFIPNKERDGIEITKNDIKNREKLIEAKEAFLKFLKIIEEFEWTDAFNICGLKKTEISDEETNNWVNKNIFSLVKDGIFNTKLVELDETLDIEQFTAPLSKIYIPYADKRLKEKKDIVKTIFDFAFKTIPEKIPKKEHYLSWYKKIDFEVFETEKLDIEKLCEQLVSKSMKLSEFSKNFGFTETQAIQYLIDLVEFIKSQENEKLFIDYHLILNQKDELVKIKGLKIDNIYHANLKPNYGEKLKNIYNTLSNSDCKTNLLHKDFEEIENLIDEEDRLDFINIAKDTDEKLETYVKNNKGNFRDGTFLQLLRDLFEWYTNCGISEDTLIQLFKYFSANRSQLYLNTKTPAELEYAFDIELSGKSEVLAKIANSSLSESDLEIIASNPDLVFSFIKWLNSKQEDNPDKELGDLGEEFLYDQLCQIFGEKHVCWEDKSEYDFRVLEDDNKTTKYYIDAKTIGKGIANSDNVPFFMRIAQWKFLDTAESREKYLIARVFKNGTNLEVKYLDLKIKKIQ